ncbi:MAG: hypothetical protein WBD87_11225 [Candidatus Acidiferrales bacterium]
MWRDIEHSQKVSAHPTRHGQQAIQVTYLHRPHKEIMAVLLFTARRRNGGQQQNGRDN